MQILWTRNARQLFARGAEGARDREHRIQLGGFFGEKTTFEGDEALSTALPLVS